MTKQKKSRKKRQSGHLNPAGSYGIGIKDSGHPAWGKEKFTPGLAVAHTLGVWQIFDPQIVPRAVGWWIMDSDHTKQKPRIHRNWSDRARNEKSRFDPPEAFQTWKKTASFLLRNIWEGGEARGKKRGKMVRDGRENLFLRWMVRMPRKIIFDERADCRRFRPSFLTRQRMKGGVGSGMKEEGRDAGADEKTFRSAWKRAELLLSRNTLKLYYGKKDR